MPALFLALALTAAPGSAEFDALARRYVLGFFTRNPVVATYLGAAALDPALSGVDGWLRDWSEKALDQEFRQWEKLRIEAVAIPETALSPSQRIDREVMLAQIDFVLREQRDRKVWRRILDTYASEAFRGVDWHLMGMRDLGAGRRGTIAEWDRVVARVQAVPAYLATAKENLRAGIEAGDPPDPRMITREGLHSVEASARYFETDLPDIAASYARGSATAPALLTRLRSAGRDAAAAYRDFRAFLVSSFLASEGPGEPLLKPAFREDRYAVGAEEYAWRLSRALRVSEPLDSIYERSTTLVSDERERLSEIARRVAEKRGLALAWGSARERAASTRRVFDELARDYPKSDDERLAWYRKTCDRLVAYARRNGMFEVTSAYQMEIATTPPALEKSLGGGSYFPAPPFKRQGVGRWYVNPTHGDREHLKTSNRASLADLVAHEGFPGHDWHFQVMTRYGAQISPVRWLLPGEVEGSASMWADSMSVEGWAHYAEALMAEPQPKDSKGFYTEEELVYESQGALYRDLRVRIDIGLHTKRLSFDDAVDLFSETVDFLPGSCREESLSPEKRASCREAEGAIYRYSKWPTQAITYRLGKERVLALRDEARRNAPGADADRRFHMLYMKQGPIPPDLFREALLVDLRPSP